MMGWGGAPEPDQPAASSAPHRRNSTPACSQPWKPPTASPPRCRRMVPDGAWHRRRSLVAGDALQLQLLPEIVGEGTFSVRRTRRRLLRLIEAARRVAARTVGSRFLARSRPLPAAPASSAPAPPTMARRDLRRVGRDDDGLPLRFALIAAPDLVAHLIAGADIGAHDLVGGVALRRRRALQVLPFTGRRHRCLGALHRVHARLRGNAPFASRCSPRLRMSSTCAADAAEALWQVPQYFGLLGGDRSRASRTVRPCAIPSAPGLPEQAGISPDGQGGIVEA